MPSVRLISIWWYSWKRDFRLPCTTHWNMEGNLPLNGVVEGTLQHKLCLIFNYIVRAKWQNLLSLGIGIVHHWPFSMATLWFEVWQATMILRLGGVNVCVFHIHRCAVVEVKVISFLLCEVESIKASSRASYAIFAHVGISWVPKSRDPMMPSKWLSDCAKWQMNVNVMQSTLWMWGGENHLS